MPETNLAFNKKNQFTTIPGGVVSIVLAIIFSFAWYQQLYLMTNYLANIITTSLTAADFKEIGVVSLKTIDATPFYNFYYKNTIVKRNDPVMCGEFGGDCYKFVNNYLKIRWINGHEENDEEWVTQDFEGHVCRPDEITEKHYS